MADPVGTTTTGSGSSGGFPISVDADQKVHVIGKTPNLDIHLPSIDIPQQPYGIDVPSNGSYHVQVDTYRSSQGNGVRFGGFVGTNIGLFGSVENSEGLSSSGAFVPVGLKIGGEAVYDPVNRTFSRYDLEGPSVGFMGVQGHWYAGVKQEVEVEILVSEEMLRQLAAFGDLHNRLEEASSKGNKEEDVKFDAGLRQIDDHIRSLVTKNARSPETDAQLREFRAQRDQMVRDHDQKLQANESQLWKFLNKEKDALGENIYQLVTREIKKQYPNASWNSLQNSKGSITYDMIRQFFPEGQRDRLSRGAIASPWMSRSTGTRSPMPPVLSSSST